MPDSSPPRLELSLPKIAAGGLAAASAAVASSWLGVAGTILGAVVVSVVATVGTALYTHSLERSRYAIRESLPAFAERVRPPRETGAHAETVDVGMTDPAGSGGRRQVAWPTVVVSSVLTLLLALAALTGVETALGKSAAQLTGAGSSRGTTLGSIVDTGGGHHPATSPPAGTKPSSPDSPITQPPASESTAPTTTGPTTTAPTAPTTTSPTSTPPTSTAPPSTEPTSTMPTSTAPTGTPQAP